MLDANSVYIIEGDGVRATSKFELPDNRDSVVLDVQAGSTARLAGGAILSGLGLVTAYIGLIVWEAGVVGNINPGSTNDGARATRVGETMVLIGLPVALLGVYLAVTTHTTVTSSSGSTFTRETPTRRWPRLALTPRGLEF
jgi:hypothetical protein